MLLLGQTARSKQLAAEKANGRIAHRLPIEQLTEFFRLHQGNPTEWTPARLALKFKLDPTQSEKLLSYYRLPGG
jgi:hypothetical protein